MRMPKWPAALLLSLCLGSCASSPPEVKVGASATVATRPIPVRRVVLVHGIWQSESRSFGRIRHALEAMGVECLGPSMKPSDGGDGLVKEAQQLKDDIDQRFGPNEHFTLVAFSMGGLASRYYLQELGGAKRCDAFYTISTPHHGTWISYLYFGKGARDMHPDSPFLKKLNATEGNLGKLPIVSYRTKADIVIVPSRSSIWDRAQNIAVSCPLHQMMTAAPAVREDMFRRMELPPQPGKEPPLPSKHRKAKASSAR